MLQSMGLQRVERNLATEQQQFNLKLYWLEAIKISRVDPGHTTLSSLILSPKLSRVGPASSNWLLGPLALNLEAEMTRGRYNRIGLGQLALSY